MDIGIDLGTTFSVIAVNGQVALQPDWPEPLYLRECDVTIIPTPFAEPTFPSVVVEDAEHPGSYCFGSEAVLKAEEGCAAAAFTKRRIGTCEDIPLATQRLTAKDVARELLRHLKSCAERALGQTVTRAVVTHPAYFDRAAVEETRQAACEAGFDMSLPAQMLMEPVAAALAYARTDARDPLRIMTYDLGGGTFDVTYLVRDSGIVEARAFDGDHLLGGYNFDRQLVQWLLTRLAARGRQTAFDSDDLDDRSRLSRLLRAAEQVKLALAAAPDDATPVDFRIRGILRDVGGADIPANERICRAEFVKLIQPYLDRTIAACRSALAKAGAAVEDLDELLLVGGSSYGPWVSAALRQAFPHVAPRLFSPDLCVGAGAAIHGKMVLPSLVAASNYSLLLDVPATSMLETVNVAGQLTEAGGGALSQTLTIRLQRRGDAEVHETVVAPAGRFLLPNVELVPEETNRFVLDVLDVRRATVFSHTFTTRCTAETAEMSGVKIALPRPLFIKTQDGMVALAEEGASLPARCRRSFLRQNSNPNISLTLYQECDPIGEIRIENIPAEAGVGATVDLEVEVTVDNEIRGKARVRTPQGCLALETGVHVQLDVAEIPAIEPLRHALGELQDLYQVVLATDEQRAAELRQRCPSQIEEIRRLLDQPLPERQEIHLALRRLRQTLCPPEDNLSPPQRIFENVAAQCRAALAEAIAKASRVLEECWAADSAEQLNKNLAAAAQATLNRAGALRRLLDTWEQKGAAARACGDTIAWARAFDTITDLAQRIDKTPAAEPPPTIVCKLYARQELSRQEQQLDKKAATLAAAGRSADWAAEIERIRNGLTAVDTEIGRIDDATEKALGLAQVRKVLARSLQPLSQAIACLGQDVTRVAY